MNLHRIMDYSRRPTHRLANVSDRPRLPYAEECRQRAISALGNVPGLADVSFAYAKGLDTVTGDWNPDMLNAVLAKGYIPTSIKQMSTDRRFATLYVKQVPRKGEYGAIDVSLKGCKVAKVARSMQEFVHDTTTMYDKATRDEWVVRYNASARLTLFGRMDHLWKTADTIWIGVDGKYVSTYGCDQYTKGSDSKRADELTRLFTFLGLM